MTYGHDHYPRAFRILLGQTQQPQPQEDEVDSGEAGPESDAPREMTASKAGTSEPAG